MSTLLIAGLFLGVGGSILLVAALDLDTTWHGDRRELTRLAKFGAVAAVVGVVILIYCTM